MSAASRPAVGPRGAISGVESSRRRPVSWYRDRLVRYGLLVVFSTLLLGPFILAFLGSFKTDREILAFPPSILPMEWRWENWLRVWETEPSPGATFQRWLFNSAFLAVAHAITNVFFCSLAAFAFARLRFRGKGTIFSLMLGSMMIPGAIFIIPGYVLMTKLGWINQFQSLLVPGLVSAFGIFMLTQFFRSIPRELDEAAIVDGANPWQVYRHVIMPLSRPALLTLTIIAFQAMWNAYLGPLLYMQDPANYTLTVGMKYFESEYDTAFNLLLVGATMNAIPVLVIFFIFSKFFIEGVSSFGVKG